MSARILISCDAVHPERTPPQCRAFLPTGVTNPMAASDIAHRAGWTATEDYDDLCPSCSRTTS